METKLSSKEIFKGHIIDVFHDEVVTSEGRKAKREVVKHVPGVSILACHEGCLYFVRQYRYAVQSYMVEIPAGLVDPGETPEEAAARELQEEVGLKPDYLKYVCNLQPSPGFLDEEHTIFYSDDFTQHELPRDPDENIQILKIPIETVRMLYRNAFFTDAKTICALGYFFSDEI